MSQELNHQPWGLWVHSLCSTLREVLVWGHQENLTGRARPLYSHIKYWGAIQQCVSFPSWSESPVVRHFQFPAMLLVCPVEGTRKRFIVCLGAFSLDQRGDQCPPLLSFVNMAPNGDSPAQWDSPFSLPQQCPMQLRQQLIMFMFNWTDSTEPIYVFVE